MASEMRFATAPCLPSAALLRNPLPNVRWAVLDSYARFLALREESNSCPASKSHLRQVQGDTPLFSVYQAFQLGYTLVFNPTTQQENGAISLNGWGDF